MGGLCKRIKPTSKSSQVSGLSVDLSDCMFYYFPHENEIQEKVWHALRDVAFIHIIFD